MSAKILIVDDEPNIRKVLRALLISDGYAVETAADGQEAIELIQHHRFDAVITDQKMPRVDGLQLLNWVKGHDAALPVILITAFGTVDAAKEAIKLGAHDYLTKPFDQDELKQILAKAVPTRRARARTELATSSGRFDIIGRVPSMQRVFELITRVADTPATVLISGESGTGKELVARALHDQSSRRDGPFVAINCGAIPKDLFEAELFGHERGAFTGAHTTRPGRFELADGGTLFLDEVGELPADLQVKLLRVLSDRSFERVGGGRSMTVDVRLIAATNRDLNEATQQGGFRQDLYYRLAVIPVQLPPLRERRDDVPLLIQHFLDRFARRLNQPVKTLGDDALAALMAYRWPGNIRELENLIERAVLLSDGDKLTLDDFPLLMPAPQAEPTLTVEGEDLCLREYVRVHTVKLERDRIRQALESDHHNVTRAARRLGISRKSLQTKMKEYGLREEPGT
jgi:two-component system response regulator AtoC